MESHYLPPPDHDPLKHADEADKHLYDLQEHFRSLTFEELRSFCLEQEPTATVGIFVLAEKCHPADSNPDAKYLMLVELLISFATLHEADIEEKVRALEDMFNLSGATNLEIIASDELPAQQEFRPIKDITE